MAPPTHLARTAPSLDILSYQFCLVLLPRGETARTMSFTVGEALSGAVDRLTTSAGALLIGGLALFGIVRTGAGQDVYRGIVEEILDELEGADFRDNLGPQQTDALETAEIAMEESIAELPLALGLGPGPAAGVWVLAYVLGLVVAVLAIDAFGREHDAPGDLGTERLGWKTLNLFFGGIVFGLLIFVGLLLFVLPGLIFLVLLVFFPAAIVLDDENFFGALGSSIGVARANVGGSIVVVLVLIVVGIVVGLTNSILEGALPDVAGAITAELLSAVVLAFTLALVARAYADATSEGQGTESGSAEDGNSEDGEPEATSTPPEEEAADAEAAPPEETSADAEAAPPEETDEDSDERP